MNNQKVFKIETNNAVVWIGYKEKMGMDYYYGGSRLIKPEKTDEEVHDDLVRLIVTESELKNTLINFSLTIAPTETNLPEGLLESKVGGGRCLIRPKSDDLYLVLSNPAAPEFQAVIDEVFKKIGGKLEDLKGILKLTPDFGKFADCSDYLYKHTQHVLGVSCDIGGCGGKSSYSTAGIVGAMEEAGFVNDTSLPVTIIGSAGAMGADLLKYFVSRKFTDIAVCDLEYDAGTMQAPAGVKVLKSVYGQFTKECLSRGGLIVASTWGKELENSPIEVLPRDSFFTLAHNFCLPEGPYGHVICEFLKEKNIAFLPGQLITLGGALTSRLEWFSRVNGVTDFDKEYAHDYAKKTVGRLTREVLNIALADDSNPVKAMNKLAGVS
jgi:hypothetical protein